MLKKTVFAFLAAAFILCMSIPAAAKTYTSYNGVLSIELPDDSWKQVNDLLNWIVLSDGGNMITINHYSNGDILPDIPISDDHYVNVYQTAYSTQNEVFIVIAYVADSAKLDQIMDAVLSTKIMVYNTKMPIKTQNNARISSFVVEPADETLYTTADGISIRLGCSIGSDILGGLSRGIPVHVIGHVTYNNQDYGWYQIEHKGITGYVLSNFFTPTAPVNAADDSIKLTGDAKTIYTNDGTAVTIYKSSDGEWYNNGVKYVQTDDYKFQTENGDVTFSANRPVNSIVPEGNPFTVYDLNGNSNTLTVYSDGYYYTPDWVRYIYDGSIYYGFDGSVLYELIDGMSIGGYSDAGTDDGESVEGGNVEGGNVEGGNVESVEG